MEKDLLTSAVKAAISSARTLGLRVEDAFVVHNSNRIAVRLAPCNVLARVATERDRHGADFEVEVAQRLAQTDCPMAPPAPQVAPAVYQQDGFVVTYWTYYEVGSSGDVRPDDYARALARMHAGMRTVTRLSVRHFMDRVAAAQRVAGDRDQSPGLEAAGRHLLSGTLAKASRDIRQHGAPEQLLHGEPHPGNLMNTKEGMLFVDFETCCRGPVEFDVAHAPDDVVERYPGLDRELLRDCRILTLAIATAWRWDRNDQLPGGPELGVEWLNQLRAALRP